MTKEINPYEALTAVVMLVGHANAAAEAVNEPIRILAKELEGTEYALSTQYEYDPATWLPRRGTGLVEKRDGATGAAGGRTDTVPSKPDLGWLTARAVEANGLVKQAETQYEAARADALGDTLVALRQKTETIAFALRTWTGGGGGT